MGCSLPNSSVRGIFQEIIQERVAIFLATPWSVAQQALPSMGFFRQGYWNGWPFPTPGDLPNLGVEPVSLALQGDSLLLSHQGSPMFID